MAVIKKLPVSFLHQHLLSPLKKTISFLCFYFGFQINREDPNLTQFCKLCDTSAGIPMYPIVQLPILTWDYVFPYYFLSLFSTPEELPSHGAPLEITAEQVSTKVTCSSSPFFRPRRWLCPWKVQEHRHAQHHVPSPTCCCACVAFWNQLNICEGKFNQKRKYKQSGCILLQSSIFKAGRHVLNEQTFSSYQ